MNYRVVFDTNVLISAILSPSGNPFRCLALAKIGEIESITCQEIIDELQEKLEIKFKFSEEMVQIALNEVKNFSRLVQITRNLKTIPDDPDDDMVVECAVIGKATHIVTGDKHLLALSNYQGIAIMKATEFIVCRLG